MSFSVGAASEFEKRISKFTKSFKAPVITVEDLKKELLVKDKVILLDARDLKEYEVSHIQSAKFVGFKKIDFAKLQKELSKDKKIVVYCSVGYRSGKVADKLISYGYKAFNLKGGLFKWFNHKNPVVNIEGEKTKRIHGYSRFWGKWLVGAEVVY